ncbi:hypothetical protein SAMN05444280_1388 [Tangfeifania diversioriginum]|uniref:ATP-grasp domain-containing protein n=2 Tax=Tangfeifania diversioriginum TaxID=1168035 RepID=A0A1M6N0J9_9BACT|nr:hypothetical protein SAMN05444280_1388 [Tangfeifania diversioriginum]
MNNKKPETHNLQPGTLLQIFPIFAFMTTQQRPNIYFFNPTCEYAVANGTTSWQPNRLLQKMEEDLGMLPLFFAKPHDIVLVKKLPTEKFLQKLKMQGISLPRFVLLEEALKYKLNGEKLNRLMPWGWSPVAHKLLEPLKSSCSVPFQHSPVFKWQPGDRELYSKKFGLQILRKTLPQLPPEKILPPSMLPEVVSNKREMETLIDRWGKLMVKAPWSSSGRGLQPITKTPVVPKVWEKLKGIVNDQGYAVAEPLLDKVMDMSLQFELKQGKVAFLGKRIFLTDKKGQYQGNFLKSKPADVSPEELQFARELPHLLKEPLVKTIESSPLAKNYEGFFGVDTLLFRDISGQLRVNPCLEINVRQNMGLLSLQLEKLLAPKSSGLFKTFYQKGKPFATFVREMQANHPLKLKDGKIESGFFALTETNDDALFGAYILTD